MSNAMLGEETEPTMSPRKALPFATNMAKRKLRKRKRSDRGRGGVKEMETQTQPQLVQVSRRRDFW
jgi:hypothetical protein